MSDVESQIKIAFPSSAESVKNGCPLCYLFMLVLATLILCASVVFDVYLYIFAGKSGTCLEDIKVVGLSLATCLLVQAITFTVSLFSAIANTVAKKLCGGNKDDNERGFWTNVKDASGIVSFIFSIFIIIAYNNHSNDICDHESKVFVHTVVNVYYALYALMGALLLGVCCIVPCMVR